MFLYFYSVPMCKNTDSWLWISVCVFMHISICISAGCYCICLCTYEYVYIYILLLYLRMLYLYLYLYPFFLDWPHFFMDLHQGGWPRPRLIGMGTGNCLVWLQLTFRWCENWDTLWCSSFFVLVINAVSIQSEVPGHHFCRVVQCSG